MGLRDGIRHAMRPVREAWGGFQFTRAKFLNGAAIALVVFVVVLASATIMTGKAVPPVSGSTGTPDSSVGANLNESLPKEVVKPVRSPGTQSSSATKSPAATPGCIAKDGERCLVKVGGLGKKGKPERHEREDDDDHEWDDLAPWLTLPMVPASAALRLAVGRRRAPKS